MQQQNIGKEKISTSQKYRFRQNIEAGKISAKKKYRHRKNIRWQQNISEGLRKNIGFNKISLEIKVARYQIGGN